MLNFAGGVKQNELDRQDADFDDCWRGSPSKMQSWCGACTLHPTATWQHTAFNSHATHHPRAATAYTHALFARHIERALHRHNIRTHAHAACVKHAETRSTPLASLSCNTSIQPCGVAVVEREARNGWIWPLLVSVAQSNERKMSYTKIKRISSVSLEIALHAHVFVDMCSDVCLSRLRKKTSHHLLVEIKVLGRSISFPDFNAPSLWV